VTSSSALGACKLRRPSSSKLQERFVVCKKTEAYTNVLGYVFYP